ncbi:Rieske 2Fe-2S domain-containing protein [Paucibacter sp. R3-3]|uniref:Rieske 2Fe-2S domain-containing protein n=1 Tax=Roseateles agri TaxID=3098619 RepID=A0ABU5DDL1_9BURK|nr:Rieske 2Fe-2S domain-containing protein [Paucibacter sp. R3-3]MDY0744219.1 Rieske 2Fe-2S domain-containing protein [Paucibacter sp. R3-3]
MPDNDKNDNAAAPLPLCPSAELQERGKAHCFDVMQYRQSATAFALRFDGEVHAYLNRCAHVPTEMDWQEGEFLDSGKQYIICSIHGAVYDPKTGRCVMGMCGRMGLTKIAVEEREGQVYWYPSRDTRPAFED